jgi:hypothetical protein
MATLPFDCEVVLTCAVCGEESTASLAGADRWSIRVGRDVCPPCNEQEGVVERLKRLAAPLEGKP